MDHNLVVAELTQGKEFALQLKIHLDDPMSSKEFQEVLIRNILGSYQKSLSLLANHGFNPNGINKEAHSHARMSITRVESEISFSETMSKEHVGRAFKDPNHKDLSAKRKGNMKKWKNQVRIIGEMRVEEALDDGYNWRKYGQKDIFGAKHPRGYYRCAYRQVQGCLAAKQVQKFDEDPSIFDITYIGSHSCNPESHTVTKGHPTMLQSIPKVEILTPSPQNQFLQSSESLSTVQQYQNTPSFHHPSSSNNKPNISMIDNSFDGSPTFRSINFSMSHPGVERNPRTMVLDSLLNDDVLIATSTTRSHSLDVGFSFGEMEIANNFNFNDSILFYQ